MSIVSLLAIGLLASNDAGTTGRTVGTMFQLPAWGTTEASTVQLWPSLGPVATVEGNSEGWRRQEIDREYLGIHMLSVSPYFDKTDGFVKVFFAFANQLGEAEAQQRARLYEQLHELFGEPQTSGSCWAVWKTPTGSVLLQQGQIGIFAPGTRHLGVDVYCLRLKPLPPVRKSRPIPPLAR